MSTRILERFGLLLTIAALAAYATIHAKRLTDAPIHSDGYSYYVYLPSFVLEHDPTLQTVADDCCGGTYPAFTSIVRWPETGRWVNPHPIGVALMTLPFFTAAHLLTRWSNLQPDGFSLYYQHAAGLSGLAACVLGFFFLRRFLRRYFPDTVVLATLAALVFGTNIFHYATWDTTFSHAFSFMLIAALLDTTDRWWREPVRWTTSLQLAVVAALIFMTRHPNAIFLIVIPLWNLSNPSAAWERRGALLAVGAFALFCAMPQLLIYKLATGHWFVSVYEELGRFDFAHPRIIEVLFGTQKGLFFWSPMLLFAVAGFFGTDHPLARQLRIGAAATFLVNLYLVASWSDWQFGASFGHRGFTDSLPIAAVFIAARFDQVGRDREARLAVTAIAILLAALSTAQMIQYWVGVLPQADTTWTQYRDTFLRFR